MPFQLQGAGGLDQLAAQGAGARLQQAGGLHGQGGAAGHHPAGAHRLADGAQQGQGIDAGMPPEAVVLGMDQQVQEGTRHIVHPRAETPHAAGGR